MAGACHKHDYNFGFMLRRNRDRLTKPSPPFRHAMKLETFPTITSFLELLRFETHSLPALARCFPRSFALVTRTASRSRQLP